MIPTIITSVKEIENKFELNGGELKI